jgi:precorrin-8X/cobalt-precorrin-8 methylmutase
MHANTVTEQLTPAGRAIEHDSFAIIDAEAGPHAYSAEQWPLVRRMIHANADFEFNGLTAFHPEAMRAGFAGGPEGQHADRRRCRNDLRRPLGAAPATLRPEHPSLHFRPRRDRTGQAPRTARGPCRRCARRWRLGKLDGAIVGIGNAPTALIELVRLIREKASGQRWSSACRSVSFRRPNRRIC